VKRITAQDVGRRVSVRHTLPGAASGPRFSDVVGELTGFTDGVLTITRRDGSVAQVPEAIVVAAKVVPPVPVRGAARISPADLQRVMSASWPAVDTYELGGWQLRAAEGFTRRANSVLGLEDPGMPLEKALGEVADWYAERSLPVCFQVVKGSPLDLGLAAAGWRAEAETIIRTAPLAAVRDRLDGIGTDGVEVTGAPTDTWLRRYHRVTEISDTVRSVISGPSGTLFADIAGGTAIGRGAVAGRFVGFSAVEVAPEQRRKGLARRVMRALTDEALAKGVTVAWLQVESDNEPAKALYDELGFTDHHRYHYRSL
jgi:GNAT superfamily N-acetyltransferase